MIVFHGRDLITLIEYARSLFSNEVSDPCNQTLGMHIACLGLRHRTRRFLFPLRKGYMHYEIWDKK